MGIKNRPLGHKKEGGEIKKNIVFMFFKEIDFQSKNREYNFNKHPST